MTKSELIQKLADRNPHLFLRDVEKIVETVFDEISSALSKGDRVELRGVGREGVIRGVHGGRVPRPVEPAAEAVLGRRRRDLRAGERRDGGRDEGPAG